MRQRSQVHMNMYAHTRVIISEGLRESTRGKRVLRESARSQLHKNMHAPTHAEREREGERMC